MLLGYAGGHYRKPFEYPKGSLLKSNNPKNTCQIFLLQNENFKPKKVLPTSPSLEFRSSTPLLEVYVGRYQMLVGLCSCGGVWSFWARDRNVQAAARQNQIWRSASQVVCSLRWFTNWRTVEATSWVDYHWLVYKFNVLHLSLFDNFVLGRTFIRRNQQPNCQHRHRFTIRKLETWTSCKWVYFWLTFSFDRYQWEFNSL